ncbi:hypothetical protein ACFY05_35570 [Microtetraspora fusca]|uniref:Tc1-like transposase DDE domain-containing protein n=1 Tax=Microtetraspora fusca TaxID=1997 RepID=A0ABW6VFL3_MICFU
MHLDTVRMWRGQLAEHRLARVGRPPPLGTPERLSSHRAQKAADRLTAAFPNAVMVHTPVHASWLNQVEIYFSAVQRKVTHNDFTDLAQVGDRLRAFEDRYNATGTAIPVEVHHLRPGRTAGQARPAHRRSQEESSFCLAA